MYTSVKARTIKAAANAGVIALAAYAIHTSDPTAFVVLVTAVVVLGIVELLLAVLPDDRPKRQSNPFHLESFDVADRLSETLARGTALGEPRAWGAEAAKMRAHDATVKLPIVGEHPHIGPLNRMMAADERTREQRGR